MLDAMSDGRALFGFGRGLSRIEFEGLQLNMGESTERMIETAHAVMTGLEQGYVEYDGKLIKQSKVRIRPEPFKSFRNRVYAPSISPNSASINAFKFGGMPYDDAQASMRLFAKEVMPELRKLGADPLFDTDAPAPPAFQAA